jgi:hypothetical protein
MKPFGFVIKKCEPKHWFLLVLPSKNAGKIGYVQYFTYISSIVRPFYLGIVSIIRAFLRLQIYSEQWIQSLYEKIL